MASALDITGYVSREVSLERRWEGKLVYFISNGKLIAFGKAVFSQMRTTQRKKKSIALDGSLAKSIAVCFPESDGH